MNLVRFLEPMLASRCAAALGLLVVVLAGGGCGQTDGNGPGTNVASPGVDASDDASFSADVNTACLSFCPPTNPAKLNLSCPSVVTSIVATGSCTATRCLAKDGGLCAQTQVTVAPTQVGVCHVDLTLADGFQYSTDVTFVQTTSESICPCTSIGPTQGMFTVNNPSTTCVDAGLDAGASDAVADAPTEAALEAGVDADRSDATGCAPITCATLGNACGLVGDGCGGIVGPCVNGAPFPVDAGPVCIAPEFCGGGGFNKCGGGAIVCAQDPCVPQTCASFDCGQAGDGCGGLLDCGPCPFSEACSENQCLWPADAGPCVPATCQGLGYDCGPASDGCGGHLDCGTCPVAQFCGGGGVHLCGGTCETPDGGPCEVTCSSDGGGRCVGQSCQGAGHVCGEVPNGCGGLLDCGPCGGDGGAPDASSDTAVDALADSGTGG
jgi:hypothetical protein